MDLFKKLGMNQTEQEEFLADAGDQLMERIIERCFENLSESEQSEFQTILDHADSQFETVFGYLDDHLPHFFDLVGQEFEEFQKDMNTINNVIINQS